MTRTLSLSAARLVRGSSLTRLMLAAGVAAFTALAVDRATPEQITAGATEREHRLADGTTIRLAPGSAMRVVREFSLWGGASARPRLIRWQRGEGSVTLSPTTLPFLIVTRDAELSVSEGAFDLATDRERGTRVRVRDGRLIVTAKALDDITRGVLVATGNRTVAESGTTVRAHLGTIEASDD